MFPIQRPPLYDTSVRSGFRVAGALLLIGMAMMFVFQAVPLFSLHGPFGSSCAQETQLKYRLSCEVGSYLLRLFPVQAQGTVLGLTSFGISLVLLAFAWLLLKPLAVKAISASTSKSNNEQT